MQRKVVQSPEFPMNPVTFDAQKKKSPFGDVK